MNELEKIYVKGVRILSPFDYDKLYEVVPKKHHKTILDVCLWTGMRYVEVQRLHEHPEWIMKNRNCIHLPEEAQKKLKRRQLERYIYPIPPQLASILPYFFDNPAPPAIENWNENLKRWSLKAEIAEREMFHENNNTRLRVITGLKGISAKMTRKTIESWMFGIRIPENEICLRQGHDKATSLRHYQGLPFTPHEKGEISTRLSSWNVGQIAEFYR